MSSDPRVDESSDLQGDAHRALGDALDWLRSTYPEHRIVVERDLVWTLQKWLIHEVTARLPRAP